MKFSKLTEIKITHDYYQEMSNDLLFELTTESVALLNAANVKIVTSPGSVSLYSDNDNKAHLDRILKGKKLTMAVVISNPKFSLVTELPKSNNQLAVYRSSESSAMLNPPKSYLQVSGRFNYSLLIDERPVTVNLSDQTGQVIEQHLIDEESKLSAISFLTKKYSAGFYEINETKDDTSHNTLISYLPELPLNTIALIEITIDNRFYSSSPPVFTLNFSARSETLNYYIVASNYSDSDFSKLALTDAGFSEQSRSEIVFVRKEPNDFSSQHISAELLTSNGNRVVLFHSSSPVTRHRKGPKKLQLRLNGETLISSLPTPGSSSVTADFFIHVAKP